MAALTSCDHKVPKLFAPDPRATHTFRNLCTAADGSVLARKATRTVFQAQSVVVGVQPTALIANAPHLHFGSFFFLAFSRRWRNPRFSDLLLPSDTESARPNPQQINARCFGSLFPRNTPPRGAWSENRRVAATRRFFLARDTDQCADTTFRPMMPAMIKPTKKNRASVAGSLNTNNPSTKVPTAPMPVQTA